MALEGRGERKMPKIGASKAIEPREFAGVAAIRNEIDVPPTASLERRSGRIDGLRPLRPVSRGPLDGAERFGQC